MRYGLVLGFILLAVAGRLIPHPDNFTPIMAIALFAGATLPSRIAYVVPLAALVASDLLLGYALDWMALVVYGCLLASVAIGQWLAKQRTWSRTGLAAVAGSLVFYLVTNFAVWVEPRGLYAHTIDGLVQCYVMAIPFFRNSLAGDLFWTALLFGLYEVGYSRLKLPRVKPTDLAS
jgi:uncharacterized protein DUF6580